MSNNEGVETNTVLLDEERRQASHQEVKASIDDVVNARIKRESARVEPKESAEVAGEIRRGLQLDRELTGGGVGGGGECLQYCLTSLGHDGPIK